MVAWDQKFGLEVREHGMVLRCDRVDPEFILSTLLRDPRVK